jgi:hypothetical protein
MDFLNALGEILRKDDSFRMPALVTENIFSYLHRMEHYKGYWVSGSALMTFGYGSD